MQKEFSTVVSLPELMSVKGVAQFLESAEAMLTEVEESSFLCGFAPASAPFADLQELAEHVLVLLLSKATDTIRMSESRDELTALDIKNAQEFQALLKERDQYMDELFEVTGAEHISMNRSTFRHAAGKFSPEQLYIASNWATWK